MARIEVRVEDTGEADEIEVIEVHVAAGDAVDTGQALMEVATDKANVDVVAPAAGTVSEVLFAEGDIVAPPDSLLVVLESA